MAKDVKPAVPIEDTELPPDFIDRVTERLELTREINSLQAKLDDINEYLKAMMVVNDLEKVRAGSATVTVSHSFRSTIKAEKLLEQGVDPKVISGATVTTEVVSMMIREDKE